MGTILRRAQIFVKSIGFGLNGRAVAFLVIVALPLLPSFQPALAGAVCTRCWFWANPPVFSHLGAYQAFQTTWVSFGSGHDVTAIEMAVVHNHLGQTLGYSTATLQLGAGANGIAYAVVSGLPP